MLAFRTPNKMHVKVESGTQQLVLIHVGARSLAFQLQCLVLMGGAVLLNKRHSRHAHFIQHVLELVDLQLSLIHI